MSGESAFILNTKEKALHKKDLSFVHSFPEDKAPANKTARHNAVKTIKKKSLFFITGFIYYLKTSLPVSHSPNL